MYYTDSTYTFEAPQGAVTFACVIPGNTIHRFTVENGAVTLNTTGFTPGRYHSQWIGESGVISSGTFEVRLSLANGTSAVDPRSTAEITLEAIDAMLAGRATSQQKKIQVGDKSIEYSSFSELLTWREHFARLVAKENGHDVPKNELLFFRRPR